MKQKNASNVHVPIYAAPYRTILRKWERAVAAGLMLLLMSVALVGCQTGGPGDVSLTFTPDASDPGLANYSTNVLQEGDVVGITFEYTTNLSTIQKIALDGTLNLQSVGPLKAAGKTCEQLRAELLKAYQAQIKDDVVTVKVVSPTACVYVSGAVFRPGKISLERPMTVLEAIMEAGGFEPDRAKLTEVSVLRLEGGRQRRFAVDVGRILDGKDVQPFYLRPFDIVQVPLKKFNL
jgi:polysaccharide export outer membrane protein